jgi:hypothetical protein
MTENPHIHISATIQKSTDDALEKYCTTEHHGKKAKLTKSHVIDDALRKYLKLKKIPR